MKQDLKSMTLAEMQDAFAAIGEPKFRAKQVFTWLHRGAVSFDAMTNLSKPLREKLDGLYDITAPSVARKQVSKLDGTIKYLWKLRDGNCVESVVMQYHHGNTVCISSEVGCPMGCKFCASTIGGLVRRLEPSELVDQVLFSQLDSGLPISNIVLMGIGEPLDNFDNVMRFLELINSPDGMNIGMRHISLSTCGLVDKIEKLAERDLQLTLSVSLHSPDDESRSKIMPVNRRWPVDTLLAACRDYFAKTGRRISFEYTMIDGVSDSPEQAELLSKKARRYGRARQHDPSQQRHGKRPAYLVPAGHPSIPVHSGSQRHHRHAPPDARQRHRRVLRPAAQKVRKNLKEEPPCRHGD